jgi:hypothetical protein
MVNISVQVCSNVLSDQLILSSLDSLENLLFVKNLIFFQSTERTPIEHELFDKFLMHDPEASMFIFINKYSLL